ncbi:MAG: hypothetical protein ACLTZT_08130 [Butyricimonas faecalis]
MPRRHDPSFPHYGRDDFCCCQTLAGDSTNYTITKMNEYDNYYLSRRHSLPLPVYKVTFGQGEGLLLLQPRILPSCHYDTNGRWKRWLYRVFTPLTSNFLSNVRCYGPWSSGLLGGAVVSFTGIVLSVKYIIRLIKSRIKQRIIKSKIKYVILPK